MRRIRAHVSGTVQGVGFRPYVHRLAHTLTLGGHVRNDARGVEIEVEGADDAVRAFLERLPLELPPLAAIDGFEITELRPQGDRAFVVATSRGEGAATVMVAPDTATCDACLRELFDPRDRRHRYPFINCTDCGPRFTIVAALPYDRPFTTMAGFTMCDACRREYDDPGDRRFHAQPNACPACGPHATLWHADGRPASLEAGRDAIAATAAALLAGAIVAVKGMGGYHLACRGDDERTVSRLRARKHREAKPFALMVPHLDAARALATIDGMEAELLTGRARPIVLLRRRVDAPIAPSVAPRLRELGVMLPYTPLHHLLLADVGLPLVMTSGNRSDEPIACDDDDARERLADIADFLLVHDRPILCRADDSVARVVTIGSGRRPMLLRRSRGYVPSPIPLAAPPLAPALGCGAHLKSAVCITRDRQAFIGPHVGDLQNVESYHSYMEGIRHLEALLAVDPATVVHDRHPDYLSSRYATERADAPLAVQHHHAHFAACLAEHGEPGPAIGVIYDGAGLGTDGTIWGGELLLGDAATTERIGSLWPVRMPGGEAAIRQPWRMACSWLLAATEREPVLPRSLAPHVDPRSWQSVARLAASSLVSPVTTSMGRLLDAIAALTGICTQARYEGEPAILLEHCAEDSVSDAYPLPVQALDDRLILDARPLVRAVACDLADGRATATIAAGVHEAVACATIEACRVVSARTGVTTAVLSGGVFQNVRLLTRIAGALAAEGWRVLVPERVPPNDGGIAFGQVACIGAHDMQRAAWHATQRGPESCAWPSPVR